VLNRVSLRARLTLWYTIVLVVVLCLGGADVLLVQGRLGLRRLDRDLNAHATTLANVIRGELAEQDNLETAADEARRTMTLPGRAVAILDTHGSALAATWAGFEPHESLVSQDRGPVTRTVRTATGEWRLHTEPFTFETKSVVLLVASPLTDVRREQREVEEAMWVGIPLVLLLAAGGGLWLAAIGLRPITEMAKQAERIPASGIEELAHADRHDEIGQFARAFNSLMARLRAALQTQRQFMADASHELRTPVSVIRTAAEVALTREGRSEDQYRETLAIVRNQAQHLSRLVGDMLVLARADAGGQTLRPVDLYLDEVVSECKKAVQLLATERGVSIQSSSGPEIPYRGDEDLLRQLVLNVLQNAVQHTPAGGSVTIDVGRHNGSITVRIADSGPGIPTADRARIFDRFVRLDSARSGNGAGLGLPIARWIAEAHRGALDLERSGPDGSTFCISLPVENSGPSTPGPPA
jgi:signal transduction histidine kinase